MRNSIIIDVILVSYSATEQLKKMTQEAIDSLLKSEVQSEIRFNIIVVDSFIQGAPYIYPNTRTIYPNEKFGYNRYLNIGISLGTAEYVCVCNNDLIFHPSWASEITKSFLEDDKLQSASPVSTEYHKKLGIDFKAGKIYGYEIEKEVCGWCIFFKRELYNTIQLFDPKYRFWFADNDYALTLQKHKIRHALITSSIVDHIRSQTLATRSKDEKRRLTTSERFFFEHKWKGRSFLSYLFNLSFYSLKLRLSMVLIAISNKLNT